MPDEQALFGKFVIETATDQVFIVIAVSLIYLSVEHGVSIEEEAAGVSKGGGDLTRLIYHLELPDRARLPLGPENVRRSAVSISPKKALL